MIPAISTTALSRRYRDQAALDDVSLVVEPGTVTGLLGRNGAGKTTLMRIVTGQEFPTSGAIRVFGQAPIENDAVLRRMVFVREEQALSGFPRGPRNPGGLMVLSELGPGAGPEGLQPEDRGASVPVSVVDVREAVIQAHHEEWARVVASLTRRFGDLDIAEEAAAEAFATAVERWPADGVPPNPGAWLTTTANRKAIDRIRRENKRDDKQKEAQLLYDDDPSEPAGAIDDERLRLIFTCCHPALATETRVALTLRMVAGLTVPEIARAFLVQEATMGQRITRAKAKIKAARIPYRVPSAEDLPARVSGVLAVLFLVFNEGYLPTGPDTDPVRHDLTAEAIRLTRLIRALMPDDGEVAGLLALMVLTEARRTARVSPSGELVTLDKQDRGTWDAELIAEGHRLVRERLAAGAAPGRYQILAAISAVHTCARDVRHTDWSQVVALYDQLVRLDPSPVIALNRAIAVAELDGPEVALAAIGRLEHRLAGYHAYHAARADLLRRLGHSQKSRAAYDKAIELAGNTAETASLTRRRDQLGSARRSRSEPEHSSGRPRGAPGGRIIRCGGEPDAGRRG